MTPGPSALAWPCHALFRSTFRFTIAVLASLGLLAVWIAPRASAAPPAALPAVASPPVGDPRLEPIPDGPITLTGIPVFGDGVPMTMRFPPRVNGQNESDGDKHADMYVLFSATTGLPISGAFAGELHHPPILEAVPKNAAGPNVDVDDLTARSFSAIWELHAVLVQDTYTPTDPTQRIDSIDKLFSSPFVTQIYQTNIFLNCPIVPVGSVAEPGSPPVQAAFWNGQTVNIAPYDVEDGGFNPQIIFDFADPSGTILNRPDGLPYLVASKAPGDPFYSSIWEIWTVQVPFGFNVAAITSGDQITAQKLPVKSAGIRLNCPVVSINGVPFPFEDWFSLLVDSTGRFNPAKFPFDQPQTQFTKSRTFTITESQPPAAAAPFGTPGIRTFPLIDPDGKANVIPLILKDPFQLSSSGPNSTGDIIRLDQAELDAAAALNPPRLPAAMEANFAALIEAGLLPPDWAPGQRSYQERLALVGQAYFNLVYKPEQGANQKDVTSCAACHSAPAAGGGGRGLYTLKRVIPERPELGLPGSLIELHPGSMWGSGGAELLVSQKKANGEAVTFAHGSRGQLPSIRSVTTGAPNAHLGIQSTEFIASQPAAKLKCDTNGDGVVSLAEAASCDLEGDGVTNEMTVGEVTAESEFLLSLPVPDQATPQTMQKVLGVDPLSVQSGRQRFQQSIDNGGAACAACHTPFHPLSNLTLPLTNPQTSSVLPITVSHHQANQDDINGGYASFLGQDGLRTYGDFRLHKMGSQMFNNGTDVIKSAELWDVGSAFPYLRNGSLGSDLRAVIQAHQGAPLANVSVQRAPQVDTPPQSSQLLTITNTSLNQINASATNPIRVVLAGALAPGIKAANASGAAPDGGLRQGAFWLITSPIPAGGSATVQLVFNNPQQLPLQYDVVVQDDAGYSEGVASARAFAALDPASQQDMINFLRAQLIGERVGEGSGGNIIPLEVAANPITGAYNTPQLVSLSANQPATIYLTIDGTTPTRNSPVYTGPISFSTEGTHTLRFFAVNAAGRASVITTEKYTIDYVPPTTTASLSPAPNAAGWYNIPAVTVALNAVDPPPGLSGVKKITYSATGAQPIAQTSVAGATASINITAEGVTTITFFATDRAGNVEALKTVTVRIDRTAPTVGVPVASFATPGQVIPGSTLATSTIQLSVALAGTDNLSGVASYELQLSTNGGPFVTVLTPSAADPSATIGKPATTTVTVPVATGSLFPQQYQFQARPTDLAGNVGAWVKGPSLQLMTTDDTMFTAGAFGVSWLTGPLAGAFGGSVHYATAPATVTFPIPASLTPIDAAWITTLGPDRGMASVSVDGGTPVTVDLYAPSLQPARVAYAFHWLPPGNHIITVKQLGTANPMSKGTRVDVDGLAVMR